MASAPTAPKPSNHIFSCRCLNIRVREAPTESTYKSFVKEGADADFAPLYVGGEGIEAKHPQLTLRDRSRSTQLPDSPNSARYTSLTCLLCQTLVYRVQEIVSPENEVKEGPVLPSDNWVEVEVLRSADGWIEIHKSLPTQEGVTLLEKSPRYSPIYSVVLPAVQPSSNTPTPNADTNARQPSPLPQRQYLADLPPLFPPPPFTPKHPVFQHLSSLATTKSEGIRKEAEEFISNVVQTKVKEIQKVEDGLKKETEDVWKAFLGAIASVKSRQQERLTSPRSSVSYPAGTFTPNGTGTPGSVIRDFVPSKVTAPRRSSSAAPRTSILSASLATSSFHHPKANDDSPPPKSPGSSASADETNSSITATSSTFPVRHTTDAGEGSVLQFRHWANEHEEKNVATSYWYAKNEEEERRRVEEMMEKRRQKQEAEKPSQVDKPLQVENAGPSTPQANGKGKEQAQAQASSQAASQPKSPTSPNGKGKRKVTFNVDPAAANKHDKSEKSSPIKDDDDDMVFDLEEENGERQSKAPTLPLVEPAVVSSRPPRPAGLSARNREPSGGLPSSFAGLRPSSLPAPSAMRSIAGSAPGGGPSAPLRPHPEQPSQPQPDPAAVPLPPTPAVNGKATSSAESSDASDVDDFRVREIQRLVAAGTPSHRHAWKRDSDAWKRFLSRHDDDDALDDIAEGDDGETEDLHLQHQHFIGSLPIAIRPPRRRTSDTATAKTSLAEKPGVLVPPLPKRRESSTARRKQMYEERDRERGLDPGALDFTGDEESDEESDGETVNGAALSRGKQRALRILESAAKVPEEGMWRSLANN